METAQLNVTISVPFTKAGLATLDTFRESMTRQLGGATKALTSDSAQEETSKAAETPKRGRGRPPKVQPVVETLEEDEFGDVDETLDIDTDELEGDEDETENDDEDETEDDDEKPAPKMMRKGAGAVAAPKDVKGALTLEGHIVPAFQKYAAKFSRDKASKVLAKYKVKTVRDLPKDKYAEVLKLLKV